MDTGTVGTAHPRSGASVTADVVVIGGGLAGLTAATFAALAGSSVRVLDARTELGGRARTAVTEGFHFNEGPHALYRAGAGMATLRELGISPKGGNPPFARSRLALDGELHRLPPRKAMKQFVGLLRHLGRDRSDRGLIDVSAREWIESRLADPTGRQLASAFVRVSSYSGDLDTFSADAAASQLHAALRGVIYLHDGWTQLVTAIEAAACTAGAKVTTGAKASEVAGDGDRWVVRSVDGSVVAASSVIVACGGALAANRIVGGGSELLAAAATAAKPVHAACLDLGLRRLPRPATMFALGIDRPTYASIHTPKARLADNGHVVHLMHYEPGDDIGLAELEALADQLQPGWRDHEVARQVGQRRVVAFDRPQVGAGLAGRPGHAVRDLPGLFVAGDWVGPDDLLGGAAIASGRAAGLAAAGHRTFAAPVVVRS